MSKTAFLFPGQGAQTVGMCAELIASSPQVRQLFVQANDILGYDLMEICLHGPAEKLDSTEISQPAIFTASFAALESMREKMPEVIEQCSGAAGLSLGEYTALSFANAISFEDGLQLVQKRGKFMQQAADTTSGGMVSVLGLDREQVHQLCSKVLQEKPGEILKEANYLCPGNIALSGTTSACELAAELAESFGAMKAIPLAVAGAFHTEMMKPADDLLSQALIPVDIKTPTIPVYSNVDFQTHTEPQDIKNTLVRQVISPVYWEEIIRKMLEDGYDKFYEVGHGRVLTGQKALVTGATRGIGRAIAITLAANGASVACIGTNEAKLNETVEFIRSAGGEADAYICNVTDSAAVTATCDKILEKWEFIDILVNNAGITRDKLLMQLEDEDWDAVLNTNLKGTFLFTRALSRVMISKRKGRIINIASVSGLMGNPGQANYSASKAGVIGFTATVAKEIAKRGVTCNAVAPGFTQTDMTAALGEVGLDIAKQQIPMKKVGQPQDIANAVLFFASPAASYITGQVLAVDGGMTC